MFFQPLSSIRGIPCFMKVPFQIRFKHPSNQTVATYKIEDKKKGYQQEKQKIKKKRRSFELLRRKRSLFWIRMWLLTIIIILTIIITGINYYNSFQMD